MNEGKLYDFHLDSYQLTNSDHKRAVTHHLYPYHANELAVFFVYGKDFTRRLNISHVPESIQILTSVIALFVSFSAIVLCIVRKMLKLRRNGLLASFIDVMIPFIGGGNIRIQHKFEKWFFGILFIGAFFIVSEFSGDLVDWVVSIWNQKINTFEQLAKINPPIFIIPTLKERSRHIEAMLRLVK